ncbi:MAG: LL-diaminopimelate aminotransferase [Vicinamibacteria bacterium]|nr:LL-diaminopimelate aminotransferase [Vicinamibacteria bacterium]
MKYDRAERLTKLPPYIFIEIDKKRKAALAAGVDLVDLGIGDPDRPTPAVLLRALANASRNPAYHQYPLGSGLPEFRQAAARWFEGRFGVRLDPASEILALIGSKEGIGHLPLAFVDPGDRVLCPDPGYPVYNAGTLFAGGVPVRLPLLSSNGYLPDFGAIKDAHLKRARILWLNYPNNPTAATAPESFFKDAVRFCKRHGIILAHDMAYSEIYYNGAPPHSVLEAPGAMDVAIEFHSLSKTFNMTGWRIGFAVGRAELISGLITVKGNLDSGVVSSIQAMAIAALEAPPELSESVRRVYQKRRDLFVSGLRRMGFDVEYPKASFYVWARVPHGATSASYSSELLEKAGIVTTPGNGFGTAGEGYIRMALTAPEERLKIALERLKAFVAR